MRKITRNIDTRLYILKLPKKSFLNVLKIVGLEFTAFVLEVIFHQLTFGTIFRLFLYLFIFMLSLFLFTEKFYGVTYLDLYLKKLKSKLSNNAYKIIWEGYTDECQTKTKIKAIDESK